VAEQAIADNRRALTTATLPGMCALGRGDPSVALAVVASEFKPGR